MRVQARPKILLARTYEEGEALFDRFEKYMLAVISDSSDRSSRSVAASSCGSWRTSSESRALYERSGRDVKTSTRGRLDPAVTVDR